MSTNERDELRDFIQSNMHRIDGFERWTFQAPVDMADAILAAGYKRPRIIETANEIRELHALTVVLHDDMAAGGPLQAFVVPDDGTVMFKDCEEFHLLTFGGDYIDAKDMPLPLTVVYEVGA